MNSFQNEKKGNVLLGRWLILLTCLFGIFASAGAAHAEDPPTYATKWSGFSGLEGVAVDASGNVYVADTGNHRIQKFSSSGMYITQWGSYGTGNGQLNCPTGVAVDASGNVYVADTNNHRIQKFSSSGTYITEWGSSGTGDWQFQYPRGVAVDSTGNVYVADTYNHRIQKFSSSGAYITKWGSGGTGDMQFQFPYAVAVDAAGNIYVGDTYNHRIQKFSSSGAHITKWGSGGTGDGQFQFTAGVAVDASGNVYVADCNNNRIQKFSSSGAYITKWGSGGSGDGQFQYPYAVAVDASGNVYVADAYNNRIQKFSYPRAFDFLTKWGSYGSGNGQFNFSSRVTVDAAGNVYVADTDNHRIQKFSSSGAYITKWGSLGTGDGRFNRPTGVAVDTAGNVYVVDRNNNRIQKFSSSGAFLTKWGSGGTGNGQFNYPWDLAVDSSGNVYVADTDNQRIQKFSSGGAYITKWGSSGPSDGQFHGPGGVAVDAAGNVYVADNLNYRIQKFSSSGAFLTKWGSYGTGNGQFNYPLGAAVDASGNVYVTDSLNNRIQKFGYLPIPHPPIISGIGNKTVREGELLQFTVNAVDADGDALTYSSGTLPTGAGFNPQTRTFTWTPARGQAGTYQNVLFTVTDSTGLFTSETITISVEHVNNPPVLNPIGDRQVNENDLLEITLGATDPDAGDTLTFSASNVPSGATWNDHTATLSWVPDFTMAGTYQNVQFTVTDNGSPRLSDSETITITVNNVNRPPVLRPIGDQSVLEGSLLEFQITAIDPDGDNMTYETGTLPEGASFNPQARLFSWTPTYEQSGPYPKVLFKVTDNGSPMLSASEYITITVGNNNRPPKLNSVGNKTVSEGATLEFQVTATDPDKDPLTYRAENLSSGASFNELTQTFLWVPSYDQAGNYSVTFRVADNGSPPLEDSETVTITVGDVNRPPVLNPIGAKRVEENQLLEILVTGTDPDNNKLSYSTGDVPSGALFDPLTQKFSWKPSFNQGGVSYTIRFSVTDDGVPSESAFEDVIIEVGNVNREPVLNPIDDKTVNEGELLSFTISGGDPDGDPLAFSASGVPSGATFDANSKTFTWTPGYDQAGAYQVTFTVSDGSLSDSKTITISVVNVNRAPVLNAIGDRSVNEGQTLTLTISGSDPDSDLITYIATGIPAGASFSGQTFTWTPDFDRAGKYSIVFTASDGSLSASEAITITVENVNRAPILLPIADKTVNEGQNLQFTVSASDPDGDEIALSASGLPHGASFNPLTGAFDWTPWYDQAGVYTVQLTVQDSVTPPGGASAAVTITVVNVNRAPVLSQIGDKTVREGELLEFHISATDPDGDPITLSASNLPEGAVFDTGTGNFSWNPSYEEAGEYPIVFTAMDSGGLSASESITITVLNVNRMPVLKPIGDKNVQEGELLEFVIEGFDPDGDSLTFEAENLPTGAVFDHVSRTFSWTPTYDQAGVYQDVLFKVIDGGSPPLTASESISITVGNVNRPPTLDPIGNREIKEGETLTIKLLGADPDGDRLTYEVSNIPPGAVLDETHTFTWTPTFTQAGIFPKVLFKVSDGSLAASEEITIAVNNVNRPPVLTEIGSRTVDEGRLIEFKVTATDEDGDALLYSVGDLPAGAKFDPDSQMFTWTPTFEQAGNYNLTFNVADSGSPQLGDSELVTITVGNVNRPPILDLIGGKSVDEGKSLTFTVGATDPDGDTLTYTASNLPSGSTFNSETHTFSWSPTFEQSGNHPNVKFTATDTGGLYASETITITVGNVNRPPVLTPIGGKSVLEGQPLTFTVTGWDPDGDTALSFEANGLPQGASFAGQTFTWTPTYDQAGEYQVEFTVKDSGSPLGVAVELVTISVGNVNRTSVFDQVGPRQVSVGQLVEFYVHATDPDGTALTYSSGPLPSGATFDPTRRLFSWRPAAGQTGNYPVTFYASDGDKTGETTVVISVSQFSPSELIAKIIQKVLDLHLSKAVENSYLANLKKVDTFIANGQRTPAINQLNAFTGKVKEDMSKGLIKVSDGNELIRMATELVNML